MRKRTKIRKISHSRYHHTIFTPYESDSEAECIAALLVRLMRLRAVIAEATNDINDISIELKRLTQEKYDKSVGGGYAQV